MQHIRRSERGASLIEFALILPIFLMLVLGMFDIGQGFNTYMGMLNATREGALWISRNPDDVAGMDDRLNYELGQIGLTAGVMTVSRTPNKTSYDADDLITVELAYPYPLLFGAVTGLPTLTLHTEHTMRVQ